MNVTRLQSNALVPEFVTLETANAIRTRRGHCLDAEDGSQMEITIREFFGTVGDAKDGPQAHMIQTYPAGAMTPAHSHDAPQFQIFFGDGGAWHEQAPMNEVVVHYCDADVVSGPFGTGSEPISFFALRPPRGPSRASYAGTVPRRNLYVDITERLNDEVTDRTVQIRPILGPAEDGMVAYLVAAGTGALVQAPQAAASSGQYCCLLEGSAQAGDIGLGRFSLGWGAPSSSAFTFTAAEPTHALILQFPIVT
jgi:hypothetical protein